MDSTAYRLTGPPRRPRSPSRRARPQDEDRVKAQCDLVGLDHGWQALVCADEEPTRDKAELYGRALAVLEVGANQASAFEDSPSGVRSAKRAACSVQQEIMRMAEAS